jgi:hypothetical protein
MSPKPHVITAFQAAGISTANAVWITTCACLVAGRYVAYYGRHGGWQIGKDRTPKTRTTVTQAQAVAWANEGVWSDGSACLNGFQVVDGVEKGREKESQTNASSLDKPQVDRSAAVLELARLGWSPEKIEGILGKA